MASSPLRRPARLSPTEVADAPRERRAGQRREKGPLVGTVVDRRYVLKREVARGGMSVVFEAVHRHTGRAVAIKMLQGEYEARNVLRERLLRESRVLETARHPNLVEVLDAGVCPSGRPFVVLEMLEGRTLDGLLTARGRLPIPDVVLVAQQLCDVLAFAHARGVVHRDLKPSNVFVTLDKHGRETIKLFDFGIAALAAGGGEAAAGAARLTRAGELLGTVEYMAPEQLLARTDVDHRCDIYSLGMTLFECLTGQLPYSGSLGELLLHFASQAPSITLRSLRAEVPAALAAAIERALAPRPDERYADAHAFADALADAAGATRGRSALLGAFQPPPGVRPPRADASASVAPRADGQPRAADASHNEATAEAPPMSRRRQPRAPYLTPARVVGADGVARDGRVEDISTGGLLLVTGELWRTGEPVSVRFALPITGTVVAVDAIVRWSRVARGRAATGMEFLGMPAAAAAVIARYVALIGPLPE